MNLYTRVYMSEVWWGVGVGIVGDGRMSTS